MSEPLIKKKNNLELLETIAIAGSFGGSIAAFFLNNIAIASLPISACLALNFINRKNLKQDTKLFHETTLFQVDKQVSDLQEKTNNSFEQISLVQAKINDNIIQNKQEVENYLQELQKQQEISAETIDRLREIIIASQAINGESKAAEYYCQRGSNYERLGYKRGAIYDYTKAIELDSSCARAFYQRGLVYIQLGERKAALEDLRRAAKFYFDRGDLVEYQKARDLSQELYEISDNSEKQEEEERVTLQGFM